MTSPDASMNSVIDSRALHAIQEDARILRAIQKVVNYNWAMERADYERARPVGRERHIFNNMKTVADWLDNNRSQQSTGDTGPSPDAPSTAFHALIEWDIEEGGVLTPEQAAETMWQNVRESDGPVVNLIDRATGETHRVDLYKAEHGVSYP